MIGDIFKQSFYPFHPNKTINIELFLECECVYLNSQAVNLKTYKLVLRLEFRVSSGVVIVHD